MKGKFNEGLAAVSYESPLGALLIMADDKAVRGIKFPGDKYPAGNDDAEILRLCIKELDEWFGGTRKDFTVPFDPGGTEFMQKVWRNVCSIPYGQTRTYGEIARKLGDIKLSRAVGLANGNNPIPIIIPCHRVVGQDGNLTGYGGGLWRKEWLLHHEARFSGKMELFH